MSDWSYVTIAYILAWGGITVYALALARRLVAARRLERRLREMTGAAVSAPETLEARESSIPAGWAAEGDTSACDVVPPAP